MSGGREKEGIGIKKTKNRRKTWGSRKKTNSDGRYKAEDRPREDTEQ